MEFRVLVDDIHERLHALEARRNYTVHWAHGELQVIHQRIAELSQALQPLTPGQLFVIQGMVTRYEALALRIISQTPEGRAAAATEKLAQGIIV